MKKILNYTERNDQISISGEDPEIKINITEENGETFYEPEIKFANDKFPDGSEVYLQPYTTQGGYVGEPVYYGTVNEPLIIKTHEPNATRDELYFRVKIIEKKNDIEKKIRKVLSFKDKIKAAGSKNLLQFGEAEIQSIFELRMLPSEIPTIMFKKGLGIKSDLKNSNYLKGIIFTGCLREILIRYIFDSDKFADCDVRDDYIKQFKFLTKKEFPKKNDDIDEIYEWLDLALERFSNYYVKKNKNLINIMPTSDIKIEDKFLYKL